MVLDIFSRHVVAWCVAPTESGELARELIADAVARHGITPGTLTIHADRGSSMTSNQVAEQDSWAPTPSGRTTQEFPRSTTLLITMARSTTRFRLSHGPGTP